MSSNPAEVVQVTMFTCTGCMKAYHSRELAEVCAQQGYPQTSFKPGDIITNIQHTYGWYEGDHETNPWVVRSEQKEDSFLGMGGCKYGFDAIWIVTAIQVIDHRVKIHAVTFGHSSEKNRKLHRWTTEKGHICPRLIEDPPIELIDWWEQNKDDWTGRLSPHLS